VDELRYYLSSEINQGQASLAHPQIIQITQMKPELETRTRNHKP